ncbi:SMC-Scp complex subunit ScpB [Schaalia sp. 19OD2882]|uniref:SMC-Scp complex subunit ScpB n=1 Tax=Schaalia sp. 19OD2882 TaxID=2794089 RepID=UPI001C1EDCF0|nr:SMC-Scp complex subunit ScpB [Schaalia sp. 19OD2882]QWW18668.1 SMC-Scp complex subunit ScpB [Schaalia sp. 19OD2882]
MDESALEGESSEVLASELLAPLEAILMVVDHPVPAGELAEALGVGDRVAEEALRLLAQEYRVPASFQGHTRPRGFELREVAGGWRIYSSPRFAEVVGRFVVGSAQARLSQAALETLAVIAYRQPVSRSRISHIRGVNVDAVVRTLVTRGLVEEVGEGPSGARLYGTTALFLERMGFDSLDDLAPLAPYLPAADELDELEETL